MIPEVDRFEFQRLNCFISDLVRPLKSRAQIIVYKEQKRQFPAEYKRTSFNGVEVLNIRSFAKDRIHATIEYAEQIS